MQHDIFINRVIVVASLMLLPLILPIGSSAAGPMEEVTAVPKKLIQGVEQIAVESVQDSLKACLGRIPLDASVGQLLLAEQNCQQVEGERTETSLTF